MITFARYRDNLFEAESPSESDIVLDFCSGSIGTCLSAVALGQHTTIKEESMPGDIAGGIRSQEQGSAGNLTWLNRAT